MAGNTREASIIRNYSHKEEARSPIQGVTPTKGNGPRASSMVRAHTHGQMARVMKAATCMARNMEMASTSIPLGIYIKANGSKTARMEEGPFTIKKETFLRKVFGDKGDSTPQN